ncbi:MAG: SH3 domain-containing protein, partial [Pelagibacteraceae bacterium]
MVRFLLLFSYFFFLSNITFSEIRSLKNNKVNVRLGPSKTYPIKFIYQNKYLPVMILDEHYNWRKIKDYDNDVGWVHISQLSRSRTTVTTINNEVIFSSPSIYSKPKAKLEIYQILIVKECNKLWCKV